MSPEHLLLSELTTPIKVWRYVKQGGKPSDDQYSSTDIDVFNQRRQFEHWSWIACVISVTVMLSAAILTFTVSAPQRVAMIGVASIVPWLVIPTPPVEVPDRATVLQACWIVSPECAVLLSAG